MTSRAWWLGMGCLLTAWAGLFGADTAAGLQPSSPAGVAAAVPESAREIPVIGEADVVVVGGTTYGVAAAAAAARAGARVFLVASHTYLGEDVAGTLQLWDAAGTFTTPLELKRRLDATLRDARVEFLLSSFATDILRDAAGNLGGVVIANRAGRQAIIARTVVDATPEALVARIAGLSVTPLPPTAGWRVIGGPAKHGARDLPVPVQAKASPSTKATAPAEPLTCHVYTLPLPVADASWAARAAAEQAARDATCDDRQLYACEVPCWPATEVTGTLPRLYRAGADPDKTGLAAAAEALQIPDVRGVAVARPAGAAATATGEVRELLAGVRTFTGKARVPQPAGALPVLGQYDVVVVGGGTSGACAGIGAARHGARTLVIEYLHNLGGVGTEGLIGKYYAGNRVGFTRDIPASPVEVRKEWYRRQLRQAGAEIWFGTLGCGALVENGRVKGVVVATPFGRGVVLARVVIDSTGSSDTAIAAGAAYTFVDESDVAVQGAGLPARNLGANYVNTDFTFADDADPLNIRALFVAARQTGGGFDVAQLIDTRERRRIVGDVVIDPLDEINGRTYPDSIVQCASAFDTHGYTVHRYFTLVPPPKGNIKAYVPYRALLPRGLDGLLVTGLGISAHRDAMPPIRMQPDLHNQGYAAGVAAALCSGAGTGVRALDVKALQRHLVAIGNLPASVMTDTDSYPPAGDRVAQAVTALGRNPAAAALVMWDPATAVPLLRAAFAEASGDTRLLYAQTLGMLGDATGAAILADAVKAAGWDKGWKFRGLGQFGASRSPLDSLILALGYTRDPRSLPVLLDKARQLAGGEFSHYHALAVALEQRADPEAAPVLAGLMQGLKGSRDDRDFALRELALARALYRCGDQNGLGRQVLEAYTHDARGPFAIHAAAALAAGSR